MQINQELVSNYFTMYVCIKTKHCHFMYLKKAFLKEKTERGHTEREREKRRERERRERETDLQTHTERGRVRYTDRQTHTHTHTHAKPLHGK